MTVHVITWECGCVTRRAHGAEAHEWDSSECTGATHGCGSGTKCTHSPLEHSAYKGHVLRVTKE